MTTTVIYGAAVQEARNRLRSAQISTMFEILRLKLFGDNGNYVPSSFDRIVNGQIAALAGRVPANAKLQEAQRRADDFLQASTVQDIFAVGDAIRLVGEYYEGAGTSVVNSFRSGLRDREAFNRSTSRARTDVASSIVDNELPELGIFKFRLAERSVMKYMERAMGPYIGADISGSTTDSLAVLAYLYFAEAGNNNPNAGDLDVSTRNRLSRGDELVPIATMVLQYHHSLIECGTALALASPSMGNNPALLNVNPYNMQTFSVQQGQGPSSDQIRPALLNGNATLQRDLNSKGLFVVRDFFDIRNNPYVDCEIALLIDNPADSKLFDLGKRYNDFSRARKLQIYDEHYVYQHRDPSLLAVAETCERELDNSTDFGGGDDDDDSALDTIQKLCKLNSSELKAAGYFDTLDAAFSAAAQAAGPANSSAQPASSSSTAPAANTGASGDATQLASRLLNLLTAGAKSS